MRVIYQGAPRCPCVAKLENWYSEDRTRIDDLAEVECDCGRRWIFMVHVDGSGWDWTPWDMNP